MLSPGVYYVLTLNLKTFVMKKIIFASIASLLFSVCTMAQTTTPPVTDKQADMKDLRKDVRDIKKDKALRHKELKEGDKAAAKEITEEIKADKKDIKHDVKDLKADGVKHPVKRAEKQIRKAGRKG